MVKCPRCEFVFDETKRTTCPICFTPLSSPTEATPQPAPPLMEPTPGPEGAASRLVPPAPQPGAPHVPLLPQSGQPVIQPKYQHSQPGSPQAVPPPQPTTPGPSIPGLPDPAQQGHPAAQPGYPQAQPGSPQASLTAQPLGASPDVPALGQPGPQPYQSAPPAPGMRVSLTGEIIDPGLSAPAPQPPRPSSYPGSVPATPPRPGRPHSAVTMPLRREGARSRSISGNAIAIVIAILVLGLGAFGGWWYLQHRTHPKTQAEKFFTAIKTMDWKTVYETSEQASTKYASAQEFEKKMNDVINQNPGAAAMMKGLASSVDFKVGEPTINGDEATVPVTISLAGINLSQMGQSGTINVKMKNFGGIWKVSSDNKNINLDADKGMGGMGAPGQGGMGGFGGMGGKQ
ncbi:MAG TPA: hypothetical protein VFB38_20030 [Chthonomonadaceae bacterium]|nr:hypothetical protein [Chthonomonadaceae bacterium]